MRNFAIGLVKDDPVGVFLPGSKEFENSVKSDMQGQPCYSPSVYDQIMYETLSNPDGDDFVSALDLTTILLNQEKYRRVLGDAVLQDIVNSMHPTRNTLQDELTDRQRLDLVISRHCQSMSERQAVLNYLSEQHADLMEAIAAQEAEQKSVEQGAADISVQ